ncbi:hypothetical protein ACOMHN_031783 [Nucella lapillus]
MSSTKNASDVPIEMPSICTSKCPRYARQNAPDVPVKCPQYARQITSDIGKPTDPEMEQSPGLWLQVIWKWRSCPQGRGEQCPAEL